MDDRFYVDEWFVMGGWLVWLCVVELVLSIWYCSCVCCCVLGCCLGVGWCVVGWVEIKKGSLGCFFVWYWYVVIIGYGVKFILFCCWCVCWICFWIFWYGLLCLWFFVDLCRMSVILMIFWFWWVGRFCCWVWCFCVFGLLSVWWIWSCLICFGRWFCGSLGEC